MGAYDSTSFFIAYWYPQISVYDDIDGWDTFDYIGDQEFNNDFSNYDVEITIPNNFAVWSTGILQNHEEVLSEKYLKRYKSAHSSDDIVHIISPRDILNKNIFNSKNENNVWHYKAENVTDFAFAVSNHYLWDATSLIVDKKTKRRVYIAAAYKEESKDFYDVPDITRKALDYYSNELPGIPFPFPGITVYDGGSGGMEFPMMVNDQSTSDYIGAVSLTTHELAHSYFPFYMGINERKYAWMDEGMARFIPYDLIWQLANYDRLAVSVNRYVRLAGKELDMPPITLSILLSGNSYGVASYDRPGIAYYYLRDALGKEKFDKTFREYIKRWNGKHPGPFDFFFTFNSVTGQNLNWYWQPWFFQKGFPDLAIQNVNQKDGNIKIIVRKIGSIPVPIKLILKGNDNKVETIYRSAQIWSDGKDEIEISDSANFKILNVELGSSQIPDINKCNNYFSLNKN
jgi:Peptidase family M1 domain